MTANNHTNPIPHIIQASYHSSRFTSLGWRETPCDALTDFLSAGSDCFFDRHAAITIIADWVTSAAQPLHLAVVRGSRASCT
jgi:hypothetical protein